MNGSNQIITTNQDINFSSFTKVVAAATYDTLTFNSGYTYNINGYATLQGNSTTNKLYLNPTLIGTPWNFNPSGPRNFTNLAPWYSNNVNSLAISALNSASSTSTVVPTATCQTAVLFCDRGFNVNWNFGSGPKAYWVGSSSNLVSGANWASTSGGAGGSASISSAYQLFFDGGGKNNATFDSSSGGTYAGIYIDSTYPGTITQQKALSLTSQGFVQNSGVFNGSTDAFTTNSFTQTGGTFNAPATMTDSGALTVSGGAFNASTTVNVAGSLVDNTTATSSGGTGPVGYWTMDEASGTGTSTDSSGNGNNGTWVGSPTATTSVPSAINFADTRALTFNGSSQYVSAGNNLQQLGAFTISAWVKLAGGGDAAQTIVTRTGSSNYITDYFLYANPGGQFALQRSNGSTYPSILTNNAISVGTWHHVVGVYNNDAGSIYVDGVLQTVTASGGALNSVTVTSGTRTTWIGRTSYPGVNADIYHFNGSIDDVRIYNRALSQAEVTTLAPSYVGYWKLDEGAGSTVADWSGFGNTGTLVASPTWTGSSGVAPTTFSNANALTFNGSSQYVKLSSAPIATIGTATTFSVSEWIYVSTLPNAIVYFSPGLYAVNGNFCFHLGIGSEYPGNSASNQLMIAASNGNVVNYYANDTSVIATGTWIHVAGVWNGTTKTAYLYKNGNLVATLNYSANAATSVTTSNWVIGAQNFNSTFSNYFNGSIDDVRIYNRALSAAEVLQLSQGQSVAPGGSISTNGNNSASSFYTASSTVNLTGGSQTLTSMGTTTFWNLIKTVSSNSTLTFSVGKVFQILNTLTLSGGSNQYLNLRSSQTGSRWNILANLLHYSFNLLNVQDSYNIATGTNSQIVAAGSTDNGNNINWLFSIPGVSIGWSGTPVATTTISSSTPITNMFGGAFTATRSSSGPTLHINSIKFAQKATIPASYVNNMYLYYGQASSTCNSGLVYNSSVMSPPGGIGPGVYSNGNYTFSALTIPVDYGTTTCLYLQYTIPATSTVPTTFGGQKIMDPVINNPLTDVIMDSGNATPSSVVGTYSGTTIDGNSLGLGSILSINTTDPTTNPTTFYVQNGTFWMHQGTTTPPVAISLTPANITATGFSFVKSAPSLGTQVVKITLNINEVDPKNPAKPVYAKTFSFTATIRVSH